MGDHAEAFALFDRDNDGKINAMDMESLIRAVGANPTEREMSNILKQFDKNGGEFDLASFKQIMGVAGRYHANEDELSKAFKVNPSLQPLTSSVLFCILFLCRF